MPKDKKFVNPLYQPTSTEPSTETETLAPTQSTTLPATEPATFSETLPSTYTSTSDDAVAHRKRGKEAFEQTHRRVTHWMNKRFVKQLERLAIEQGKAKSTMLDEAIEDLFRKYGM